MDFYVTIGNRLTKDYRYYWSVSYGTIISGQGTSMISVGTNGSMAGSNVTATIKVSGLPKDCENSGAETGSIIQKIEGDPVDRFGKSTQGWVRARLDNFFVQLINDAGSEGLIELKINKNWNVGQKASFVKLRYDHLNYRKFDKTRITFSIDLNESYDEEETVLWIVPPGAEFPGKDDKNIRFVKAEDMDKELGKLFKNTRSK